MTSDSSAEAYAFNLSLVCGGYGYYSTFSGWVGQGQHGREVRAASPVVLCRYQTSLFDLGQQALIINDHSDYEYWLVHKGWGLASIEYARSAMAQWLDGRECVVNSVGTYTDVGIASPSALNHSISRHKRSRVLERDFHRCLDCGRRAPEVKLTMHHVRPFSRGGETTVRNLVCLCEACNQRIADKELQHFYDLARIPSDIDRGLIRGEVTKKAIDDAFQLSRNMLHMRCEVE